MSKNKKSGCNADTKFADKLVAECKKNPEQAAKALVQISNRICENDVTDLNSVLAKLHLMEDGEAASELTGADNEVCGAYAKLMRDAFLVPIILTTLKKDGMLLLLPIHTKEEVKAAKDSFQGMSAQLEEAVEKQDLLWASLESAEQQIQGLIAFQVATDIKSPYGQLILNMAAIILSQIAIRRAFKTDTSGNQCQL